MKVRARLGAFTDKDARVIADFLRVSFPKGQYTPKDVVEKARSRNSPIHRYFEWDDTKAAEKWRLRQAKKLITCYVVIVDEKPTPPVVSVRLNNRRVYMDTDKASENESLWEQVMRDALTGLESWQLRYENLSSVSEFHPAFEGINKTKENVRGKENSKRKAARAG